MIIFKWKILAHRRSICIFFNIYRFIIVDRIPGAIISRCIKLLASRESAFDNSKNQITEIIKIFSLNSSGFSILFWNYHWKKWAKNGLNDENTDRNRSHTFLGFKLLLQSWAHLKPLELRGARFQQLDLSTGKDSYNFGIMRAYFG